VDGEVLFIAQQPGGSKTWPRAAERRRQPVPLVQQPALAARVTLLLKRLLPALHQKP
jgi:hypothetical protein